MKKGFTLVEVMFVVATIAILAMIAIPGILKVKMNANEASVRNTLKGFCGALEQYMLTNGSYPTDVNLIVGVNPPYYPENIIGTVRTGYNFTINNLTPPSYSITATPLSCGKTGSKTFTATSGHELTEADCI